MFKHIVVLLDGSEFSEQALPHAEGLAKQIGAKLLLLRVVPEPNVPAAPLNVAAVEEAEQQEAQSYIREMESRVSSAGVAEVHSREEMGENIKDTILRVAEEEACDLIVAATHGRTGIARTIYGSIADELVRDATLPVLVIKGEES